MKRFISILFVSLALALSLNAKEYNKDGVIVSNEKDLSAINNVLNNKAEFKTAIFIPELELWYVTTYKINRYILKYGDEIAEEAVDLIKNHDDFTYYDADNSVLYDFGLERVYHQMELTNEAAGALLVSVSNYLK